MLQPLRRILAAPALALAGLLALGGCAPLVPQTVALRTAWPAGVPQSAAIPGVPFFPQDEYQCGPAALATVLAHGGVAVTPQPLVEQVWLPGRRGSLQAELLAAARRHDRVPYVLAPRYGDLLREVAAGHPVLVLQDVGVLRTQWHYAVVNGYDYPTGTVLLRSGTEPRREMSFTAFERSWAPGGSWGVVAMPPDRIPATATEDAWTQSVVSMARVASPVAAATAYATLLRRWPDNLPASVGLANLLHARGDLAQAEAVLRTALGHHPRSAILANNLAQVLADAGRPREALALLEGLAQDDAQPYVAELRDTRAAILEQLGGGSAPR